MFIFIYIYFHLYFYLHFYFIFIFILILFILFYFYFILCLSLFLFLFLFLLIGTRPPNNPVVVNCIQKHAKTLKNADLTCYLNTLRFIVKCIQKHVKTHQNADLTCYLNTLGFPKRQRETTHKVIVDPGVKPSWMWKITETPGNYKNLNFQEFP